MRQIGAEHFADQADRFWALKDVSFDIEQGNRVGVIGRNGAGKSTLLKILSRITAPTEGLVKIKGRIVSLLEVGTGFHPELTGRENIYLNGAILGMKRWQIKERLDEIINFSEIEQFIDTPVKRYSSGMYVRLAFSVAAHLDSDILIADEVLAVGDAAFQKKCIGEMKSISSNNGKTIIFVSHQMTAIKKLCSNGGMIMEKGRIINECDTVDNLISSYFGSISEYGKDRMFYIGENDENEYICLDSIEIKNPAGSNEITIKTGFIIDVRFDCKVAGINLDCTIQITDEEDTIISHRPGIVSDNNNSEITKYHVSARYPGFVVNASKYKVTLIFGKNQQEALLRKDDIVWFTVNEIVYEKGTVLRKTPGYIYPNIDWKIESESVR